MGEDVLPDLKTLAIIVNYRSCAFTLRAVESILASDSLGPVSVAVVDNSVLKEETERLRSNLPPSVNLRVNDRNMGFGFACNQAFMEFESDGILLINPDARLLPGCLKRLQETLFLGSQIAAVSPQLFWDDDQKFYLPPPYPIPLFEFRSLLASWGPRAWVNRVVSFLWRKKSLKLWQSENPLAVSNLSGGLVLLDRKAVSRVGGLFDPRFFLYFEDTDLFLRLTDTGYRLLIEPRAKAIHYHDQCGRQELPEKRRFMAESHDVFLRKHGKAWKLNLKKTLERFLAPASLNEKGSNGPVFRRPFSLKVPPCLQKGWLFEWSPNSDLVPAAGRFGSGLKMRFSETCWELLSPGRYFGRLGGMKRFGAPFQQVSFVKDETAPIGQKGKEQSPDGISL
jgi:GT2 family glycosyltransferase